MKIANPILGNILLQIFLIVNLDAASVYLDSTFGAARQGFVTQSFGVDSQALSVKMQEGKIVAAGTSLINGKYYMTLLRYLASGELDTDFGDAGVIQLTVEEGLTVHDMDHYDADRLIAVGAALINRNPQLVGVRLYNDGTLDLSLAGTGIVVYPSYGVLEGVLIKTNGQMIVLANAAMVGNEQIALYLAQLNVNGSPDTNFGPNGTGITKVPVAGLSDFAKALCLADDKILVAGYINSFNGQKIFCARFNANGFIDTSFGDNGLVLAPLPTGDNAHGHFVGVQSTGNIILVGATDKAFVVLRLTPSGAVDTSFGSQGFVITPIGTKAHAYTATIQSDDKIVVAGLSDDHIAVARYSATGGLDTTFGDNGIARTAVGDLDSARSVTVQDDGKIIVAGFADNKIALARYRADSTADEIGVLSPAATTITTNTFSMNGHSSQSEATVRIKIDGTLITATTTDAYGNWNAGTSNVIADGEHVFVSELMSGETVLETDSHTFTMASTSPAIAITGPVPGSTVITQTPILTGGASKPSANVRISIDGTVLDTVTTNSLGGWSKTAAQLANGSHTLFVELMDGETVLASDTKTFTVGVPLYVAVSQPTLGSTITSSSTSITGTSSSAGSTVQVFVDWQFFASATTSANGDWDAGTKSNLSNGTHTITLFVADSSGSVKTTGSVYFTVNQE